MNYLRSNRQSFGKVILAVLMMLALQHGVAGAQSSTPVITGLLPASVRAGAAGFTLNVLGSQFVTGAVVQWNGSSRLTSFFSAPTRSP
jgi:hypothetical protein